ncbi:hypothetical protein MNBD_DELTA02-1136 [hydrothermal vent metagenome]|uniref:Uncharacterized protein n=1 Tax=hydrothermal vent metagenome TaxID=652676 RepID=A0A3B0VTN8_9ZZZZ
MLHTKIIPILASIGFVMVVMTFIGGFRMVRRAEHMSESIMHRVNGYTTISIYVLIALISIGLDFDIRILPVWIFGFILHYFKLVLVKKKLAVRYGGYMGGLLLITWFVLIYSHLPK